LLDNWSMSVRPVGSSPASVGSVSQARKTVSDGSGGANASFADLTGGSDQGAAPEPVARESAAVAPPAGGDALGNIAAAYFIFGGGARGDQD
jgi:hypothetical protein